MRKIKDFLLTDIKVINKYFLVIFTIVLLTIVGATSYALFTYELESNNSFGIKYVKIEAPVLFDCDTIGEEEGDGAGVMPNSPSLASASYMIPVCYNSENNVWVKADGSNNDSNHKWYSYSNRYWANAVTVTDASRSTYVSSSAGTVINMDDITNMLVWIPKYAYSAFSSMQENFAGGTQDSPGAIGIQFLDVGAQVDTTVWYPHPAFTFGGEDISGIWVGKFEISHETLSNSTNSNNLECTTTSCSSANGLRTLPNVMSLVANDPANMFFGIKSMQSSSNTFGFTNNADVHMIKNSEWGAVAYLSQSIYGRCTDDTTCPDIGINNGMETGLGATAGSDNSAENGTYETAYGQEASTTSNIYGVYDMSGGNFEFVMAKSTTQSYAGGFSGTSLTNFNAINTNNKYIDSFEYDNSITCTDALTGFNMCFGQAYQDETNMWYADEAMFGNDSWMSRGGFYMQGASAGIFSYRGTMPEDGTTTSRMVVVVYN